MSILEKYYRISQIAGVSLTILQNGTVTIYACVVIANGNQLNIDRKILDVKAIEDLKKHISAKFPLALNISGKGVLYKQIEKAEEINQSNFNKILPNANIDDFYVQNFVSGDQSFVSVIRKTDADKWIELLKDQGFMPLSLSFGPFPAQHIFPQLNVYGSEVIFSGNTIRRNEQLEWISYQYGEIGATPFALKIESEVINEKLIAPYAAAFQLVMASQLELIQANVSSLSIDLQNKLNIKKVKVQGSLILSIFFFLLLVNFIIFSWLNSSNARLTEQVSSFAQTTSNVQDINEQVRKKEAILQNLGWDGGISKSSLVDQLAALMPDEISLRELAVNPVDLNSSRTQKSLIFFRRRVRITGNSDKIIPVNEWMARMKTKIWVKNMQLESYVFNSESNTGLFTIILDY